MNEAEKQSIKEMLKDLEPDTRVRIFALGYTKSWLIIVGGTRMFTTQKNYEGQTIFAGSLDGAIEAIEFFE